MAGIAADGAPWLRSPIHLSDTAPIPDPQAAAPNYGADTRAILREAGYTEEELAALLASGAAAEFGGELSIR